MGHQTRRPVRKNEQYDPEYLKYNPKGVVPTLVHDDNVVAESTLICEYLEETFQNRRSYRRRPTIAPDAPVEQTDRRRYIRSAPEK